MKNLSVRHINMCEQGIAGSLRINIFGFFSLSKKIGLLIAYFIK